jgi:GR25 family glycosyltransferase involved in LPS biosynthesis
MIHAFVINLEKNSSKYETFLKNFSSLPESERSQIQLNRFNAVNGMEIVHNDLIKMGFDTYRAWRDPYYNRKFTHGEIGCVLSHVKLWEKCVELNEPILVFEDDIEFLPNFSIADVQSVLQTNEFVYLSRKDMLGQQKRISDKLVVPSYSYWTCAYALTPAAAKKLLTPFALKHLLPADEYLPVFLNNHPSKELNDCFEFLPKIYPLAFEPHFCKPIAGAFNSSDTEIGGSTKYFKDFDIKVRTVATDTQKAKQLIHSAEKNNLNLKILGANGLWTGGDIKNGPGGGLKVNLLRQELKSLQDNDVVLFVDGYDVLINAKEEEIFKRYLEFNTKVLFAAEKVCWPDRSLENQFPLPETGYRYLNSGCFIGVVSELKKIMQESLSDIDDDQLYLQKKYLSGQFNIKLDHEGYIFQCVSMVEPHIHINAYKQLVNTETHCTGLILHGNGGPKSKQKFDEIFNQIFENEDLISPPYIHKFYTDKTIKTIGPEIIVMKFMTPEMCSEIIDLAEKTAAKNGGFKPLDYDKFPGQELRIKQIDTDLWNAIEKNLVERVFPAIEEYWFPLKMWGIRDLFVIKYSLDGQSSLACHNDASMVSGTVKLNNEYTGADLYFRRQKVSNKDIEVGDLLLWPGQVTHGHESLPITSGTKYSLVLWTQRNPRDQM